MSMCAQVADAAVCKEFTYARVTPFLTVVPIQSHPYGS